jgi:hemerythrin-like domain-containing protein
MTSPITLHPGPAAGFDQPFEMLGACHDRVRRMLALLARLREHLRSQGADAQARQAAADVLRYFEQAAPAHHEDEERHVFPLLLREGDAAQRAVVERLRADHLAMAAQWPRVQTMLLRVAGAGAAPDADEEAACDAFAALYAGHLPAEDGVAFPAARARMDGAAQQAMGEEMARRRGLAA